MTDSRRGAANPSYVAACVVAALLVGIADAGDPATPKLFDLDPNGEAAPSRPSHWDVWFDDFVADDRVVRLPCVTDRTDLAGLDAQDPTWVYKRSADDAGWRFEKPK